MLHQDSRHPKPSRRRITAIAESKAALAVVKKQKDNGVWGGNLLGLAPSTALGIKDVGTIPQYRRLLQLEWPRGGRPFKLADRVLFRLLSRDEDPALLFEFQKMVKSDTEAEAWARGIMREASSAALAEAGYAEDPRLRGAGHKIANAISQFLRSPLAEKPFLKSGKAMVLHPEAHPPSWYSVAMLAFDAQSSARARGIHRAPGPLPGAAGAQEAVRHPGRQADRQAAAPPPRRPDRGRLARVCRATSRWLLHYIELLARMGALPWAPVATKVLGRLLKDCDDNGIWHPKNLRSQPKAVNKITYHYYPLLLDAKTTEGREVDITFRLALIAKLLGWSLDHVLGTSSALALLDSSSRAYYYA